MLIELQLLTCLQFLEVLLKIMKVDITHIDVVRYIIFFLFQLTYNVIYLQSHYIY